MLFYICLVILWFLTHILSILAQQTSPKTLLLQSPLRRRQPPPRLTRRPSPGWRPMRRAIFRHFWLVLWPPGFRGRPSFFWGGLKELLYGCFQKWGYPKMDGFIMENPIKICSEYGHLIHVSPYTHTSFWLKGKSACTSIVFEDHIFWLW